MNAFSFILFLGMLPLGILAAERKQMEVPKAFFQQYCANCHLDGKRKGDLALDPLFKGDSTDHRQQWAHVMQALANHVMPPENKAQPTSKEREAVLNWIEAKYFAADCDNPDPGRVTIRRLNRAEYNNTIRDLVGVNFRPADDFPVDDSGYGFDTIGDALSLPPVLLEKYLGAAQKIFDQALVLHDPNAITTNTYALDLLEVGYNARKQGDGWVFLNSYEEDDVAAHQLIKIPGEYVIRVRAYSKQDSSEPIKLAFMLNREKVHEVIVSSNGPAFYEARASTLPGTNRFSAVVLRKKENLTAAEAAQWKTGMPQKGAVLVHSLTIEGPYNVTQAELPETHRRIFFKTPPEGKELATARELIERFAKRAFRRPVQKQELDRLVTIAKRGWDSGESFEAGVAMALQATLVSPHFLFRGELQPEPNNPKSVHAINEFALASRLSYFLWSTMPDDELFRLAERKQLRRNLQKQVRRMLDDPKSQALVQNFAGQWLQLRNVDLAQPDEELFPEFDEDLRRAMRMETELLFTHIMREDRSILELLSADYTFLNERLARHYGVSGVTGENFQKVSTMGTNRRGLLGHGSILMITSNPTRTSPVKRGKWVLDNLLNTPPPPAPPDVPELKEDKKELTGTLRQRMEQHREDPTCASCHARMDPIGFGLENFNAIGGWRIKDGTHPVDSSGQLLTGESFNNALELTNILLERKREEVTRCLANKMLTYALGRGLEYYDKCALDQITRHLQKNNYHFSELILAITQSTPFQKRRGDQVAP